MIFSSTIFLVYFFPIFILLYIICPTRFKNIFLLITSIAFYSWGAPKFIFVILGTTTVDYFLVKKMYYCQKDKERKLFLFLSLLLNIGLLFYFKYCNFFIDNFNEALSYVGVKEVSWTKVVLPIGISFYTFESLTYVIDIYRRQHKPLNNFWQYQLYIILFPKLIAGPIIRYHEISDQITDRSKNDTVDNKIIGFSRFCIGLAKKVMIANVMAVEADRIFSLPITEISTYTSWIGMIAYTFQIYFDFSGYSDMAIGIGNFLGFKFPENFNNPYTSGSITEFWRRWHMTLGNWMRNYLYIPLGGNKVKSNFRLYLNLWIVFIASGFWHGAEWTFIIWGVYHGLFLVLERLFLLKVYNFVGKYLSLLCTFFIVAIGWVLFRSNDLKQALSIIKSLFVYKSGVEYFAEPGFFTILILCFVFSLFILLPFGKKIQENVFSPTKFPNSLTITFGLISIVLYFLALGAVSSSGFNPFIYFRF